MGKGYEDLSRRALIQLDKDFDQVSDGALIDYLTENSDKYESVRPVEKILARADQIADAAGDSMGIVKDTLVKESGKLLDNLIDSIASIME